MFTNSMLQNQFEAQLVGGLGLPYDPEILELRTYRSVQQQKAIAIIRWLLSTSNNDNSKSNELVKASELMARFDFEPGRYELLFASPAAGRFAMIFTKNQIQAYLQAGWHNKMLNCMKKNKNFLKNLWHHKRSINESILHVTTFNA